MTSKATTKPLKPARNVHHQPSVEEIEDEQHMQPRRDVPKKASHILELADGSDDNDDAPELVAIEDSEDEDDQEAAAESMEADLNCLLKE
ncbi:hypothetical protein M413DRAFT_33042 [Hebeloma cylindrosporum]|uniref:Uncharacterized protein n=1 Tax=Hebeloma cylindrosporum TaxID=76867 RepID=A0A0C2Y0Y2_HEBCY|nr:hypothetical protein M413DRAFT_33042 [Hebeloma cylindrosporum h7]